MTLFAAQFIGLAFLRNYVWIAATFVVAGLGNALFDPALTASILDIAPEEHRAGVMGLKSTASSIGSILGPALMVVFAPMLRPQSIFLGAAIIVGMSVVLLVVIRGGRAETDRVRNPAIEHSPD
jgi:MFS family permease